jgi:hypothetical protein
MRKMRKMRENEETEENEEIEENSAPWPSLGGCRKRRG